MQGIAFAIANTTPDLGLVNRLRRRQDERRARRTLERELADYATLGDRRPRDPDGRVGRRRQRRRRHPRPPGPSRPLPQPLTEDPVLPAARGFGTGPVGSAGRGRPLT